MLRTRVCSRQLSNSCLFSKQMERSISSVWRLVLPCFSKSGGLTYEESVKGAIDSLWPESSWVSEMLPSSQRTAILSLKTKLSMKASNREPGNVYQQVISVVKVFQSQVLYDSVWETAKSSLDEKLKKDIFKLTPYIRYPWTLGRLLQLSQNH